MDNYPFLSNMVAAYEEFNKDVIDEEKKIGVTLIRNAKRIVGYRDMDNHVYEKLIRNLSKLLNQEYRKISNTDYCAFLYQWYCSSRGKKKCQYYSYDKDYENSINIIKLQNFHHNVDTIRDILIKKSEPQERNSQYCYAQRYANECVKIYRNIHDEFCSGDKSYLTKNQKTCTQLTTFNSIYTTFLFNQGDIYKKIPDLSSSENEKHFGCPSDKPAPGTDLIQGLGEELEMASQSGPGHGSISDSAKQSESTIPFNATAVVGTMIGIPPFLGLIYRFTPVGTTFRIKNNKSINVFNNLDEQIEKELYYPRHETAAINYNHARYNVAYGPV
ncbi:PIR protein [Plasmodium vivax]|uniref:VIR protein n=1 Tax=Plasmodium vivax TaxID=5855 RepID=A0A565A643_PLAVI|nr:PIR protein [Plasmodium vivax]